jgi:hypothetical protein
MSVKDFKPDRVYPNGTPDDFGQVNTADKDRSRLGQFPDLSVEAHYRSDIDSAKGAQHHSIGTGRNQASSGAHSHDGVSGLKIGPREFDPTPGQEGKTRPALTLTGSKAGNAALASLIAYLGNFFEFRDLTT